ncbi:hypothetical protein [Neptunicella sp.]|uniref:hypothetical protein n=1 Tax=Neptunicella sp. TaxID=2125986 RepID=UPI003F693E98
MKRLFKVTIWLLVMFSSFNAAALTAEQFNQICQSTPGDCSNNGTLQAYVGGALDLLATLNEQTNYLDKLYCKQSKQLFDVAAIIGFIQTHSNESQQQNAMLLMVRYFEQNGGCKDNE